MEITIETLAREIVEYFRNHNLDQEGLIIYLQAIDIIGDIQVYPIDNK
jgi:hypothetical protein